MNKLKRILFNKGSSIALAIITTALAIVPEDCFKFMKINQKWSDGVNVMLIRLAISLIILIVANILYYFYCKNRKVVTISGNNYSVQIEYGDLLSITDGKVVIHFDECFTTKVGDKPGDVKADSVCGQYLEAHPIGNIKVLIQRAGLEPEEEPSRYKSQIRYKSGTILPRENYLLMAFAKLDERGIGTLSYEQYLECLNNMWEQIERYRGTDDIYLPILGSRLTVFDKDLSQQELLDIMINSYRLSSRKLKIPNKLHIVCKEREGFSLNNIDGVD